MARYGAEERITARERMLLGTNQDREDPTAHVQKGTTNIDTPKGESAAIIAEKAGVKTRNVYEVRAAKAKGVPEVEGMQWPPPSREWPSSTHQVKSKVYLFLVAPTNLIGGVLPCAFLIC